MNRDHKPQRARAGYAMLIVMIVIMTTTAFAAVHQRYLIASLRVEQARVESENYANGPLTVLAVAIERMDTGNPPAPVNYRYSHTVAAVTTLYRIGYTQAGTQWTVTAEPDATAGSLPTLPASF